MHFNLFVFGESNSSKYEEFDWEAASQVNISFKCPRFHPHPIHPGRHTFLTQFSFFVYIALIFLIYLRYFVVAQKVSKILQFIALPKVSGQDKISQRICNQTNLRNCQFHYVSFLFQPLFLNLVKHIFEYFRLTALVKN